MHKNEQLFIKKIRHKVLKTIYKFGLINNGEKIIVGVSGGKDSLVLLDTLVYFKRKVKLDFDLSSIYVDIQNMPYDSDKEYMRRFCENLNVNLNIVEYEIDEPENGKSPCFICSWNRRKSLFDEAKRLGAVKVALGHHLDDVLQTLLMNMTFHSNISTTPPLLKMNKWDCALIRPLSMCAEDDLQRYSDIMEFQVQEKVCPFGDDTSRLKMKKIVNEIGALSHNAKINLFHSLSNILGEYLPAKKEN